MILVKIRKQVNDLLREKQHAERRFQEERAALQEAKEHYQAATEAQTIIQTAAQEVQQRVHDRIASVVSRCLSAVFDEPYSFRITFERKRGRTEARLSFVRDGREYEPTTASGGGVIDVASVALRLCCLLLSRPRKRMLLCLDEPMRMLDTERQPRMAELLLVLAEELQCQFIIVTHSESFQIGKVIRL